MWSRGQRGRSSSKSDTSRRVCSSFLVSSASSSPVHVREDDFVSLSDCRMPEKLEKLTLVPGITQCPLIAY